MISAPKPTIRNILGKGFFPKELPPPFSTWAFADVVTDPKGFATGFETSRTGVDAPAMCIHNMVRSGGLRRDLGIPNPISYAAMAEGIVDLWVQILPFLNTSPFTLTTPTPVSLRRAIESEHSFDERTARRIELRTKAKYILQADINRFYPSLYTHSIPWAVHGKSTVKSAMVSRSLRTLWADRLDVLVRWQNANQTLGIPIGPDCSLVVAEIVLSAVDQELQSRHPYLSGLRYIDDYEFAFHDRSDAERVMNDLQSILSAYGLALNSSKTRIVEMPAAVEPLWISKLRTFFFRDAGVRGQKNDITAFFDRAFDSMGNAPDEGILKYAVPRLNSVDVYEANWSIYQDLLAHCVLVEPACLPQVAEQLLHYKGCGYPISADLWSRCLNGVVADRLPLGQASEPAWAMWLVHILDLRLNCVAERAIAHSEDSIAALMALGLASAGRANKSAMDNLNAFAEPPELFGPQWLLAYEGAHRGWLHAPSGADTMSRDPRFGFLHERDVSFFDIDAPPPTPRRNEYTGGGGGGY